MRSVMSGMLRRNSAVRIGPSSSRHMMVPFQRPSITVSAASIGQSLTPFFDTAITRLQSCCQICQYLVFCQHSDQG